MSLTLVVLNNSAGQSAEEKTRTVPDSGVLTIGRLPERSDWVLSDPNRRVSGRHCTIENRINQYYITDNSANGLFVNGSRLGKGNNYKLKDGDSLALCNPPVYELQVVIEEAIDSTPAQDSPSDDKSVDSIPWPSWPPEGPESDNNTEPENNPAKEVIWPPEIVDYEYSAEIQSNEDSSRWQQETEKIHKPATSSYGSSAALKAFLDAAGLRDGELGDVDIERIMTMLGGFFRETVHGLLELLETRNTVKKELHIPRYTMVGSQNNNPFKVVKDEEWDRNKELETIMLLLLTTRQGAVYQPATEAIQEVFDDIKAHEKALLAGMEAALTQLLERFRPDNLASKLQHKSLIPVTRKAKYWEEFTRLYDEIVKEERDDFQRLFDGKFEDTYEQEVRSINSRRRR